MASVDSEQYDFYVMATDGSGKQ